MDSLRGNFSENDTSEEVFDDWGFGEDEIGSEAPPLAIGTDERRMQVRAYNFWAGLLGERSFPSIEDLDPDHLPDFGPFSVLLDFTSGIENPAIQFLGSELALECGTGNQIGQLADVPARSLLSRITDHYLQIIANQAPIGFEAEFVNQRGQTVLYRGILLPFSSDGETIDFIYGVINWKELADQQTTDDLLLEIDQALQPLPETARDDGPLTEWADGPAELELDGDDILDLVAEFEAADDIGDDWPEPAPYASEDAVEVPLSEHDADAMGLADWLASARELAEVARTSEDRSRQSLYAAIGRAHDFALAAADHPEDFAELVADAGLAVQDRAPLTPLVKLVFGATYDKTRIAEYVAVLGHAQRVGLERGALADYLAKAAGGLKGLVQSERALRQGKESHCEQPRKSPRIGLVRKLRKLEHKPLSAVSSEGSEIALLVARRLPTGEVVLLGEVSDNPVLLDKAARHLLS